MPHHLVSVWNPSYADDAMERHLAVLLERARRPGASEDDAYVWWGKVRSPHRQQAEATHQQAILDIDAALAADAGAEVQLYLTDYRSLYVAQIDQIERTLDAAERAAAPDYYFRSDLHCDCWFLLGDIRLLVADDLLGVIAELRRLHNVHYHDKPVSLYGGMVDLPLVVRRPDGQRFFDREERDAITGGRLWAVWDAEQGGGVAKMEAELRENVVGETAWRGLEATTRRFIASGEQIFRAHRGDPAFDFGPVLGAFAKALEVECRVALRRLLDGAPPAARHVNVDGRSVDLAAAPRVTLGQIARALCTEKSLADALRARGPLGAWLVQGLGPVLADFVEVRNPGVHEVRVDRATATRWRDRVLGVGCEGVFERLGAR
jgi:hypothetical protein